MLKNKFKKSISTILTLAFTGTTLHCGAANIIPINGGHVAVPPSIPVTKTSVDSKIPNGGVSLQAIKSKIDEIINLQKNKAVLREIYSGTCGDNVNWELNTDTGVLNITGSGEIYNFNIKQKPPWLEYRDFIKTVKIENGVSSIGSLTFFDCKELTSIEIPDSVTSIEDHAFVFCDSLTSVTIPSQVTFIGIEAFDSCSSLAHVCYLGTNDPMIISPYSNCVFCNCKKLNTISVTGNYTDNVFCGWPISKVDYNKCEQADNVSWISKNLVWLIPTAIAGLAAIVTGIVLTVKCCCSNHRCLSYEKV